MKIIFRDLIVLIFLISIIVFLWFSKGLIFAGGEEGIPFYDLNKTLQFVSFTWQDISAGYPTQLNLNRIPYFTFLKMFYSFGIPGYLIQAMHFFIIMSVGTLSLYFLLRETLLKELETKSNNLFKLVPLIGAIFYLLNPFSMTQIWGRGIYIQFFPFALFPMSLLIFILGLRNKNFVYAIFGILASYFLAGAYGNPSYIISQWLILFIYLVFYIIKNKTKKEIIFSSLFFLFMIVGWIMVQMWWIYPFIKTSANQFSAALSNLEENIGTLKGVSKDYKLYNILRLVHAGYIYRDLQYGSIYTSPFFIMLSWLIPITSLFSYPIFKKLKFFLFFGTFFLFALFICIGSNLPTGWLFVLIFKTFPILQSFRNPFEKFGVILTIAYAPFFAIGAVVLSKRIGKSYKDSLSIVVLLLLIVLVFGVFLWPIWTGQFAGGIRVSPWIKVPHYYKSLDDWLNKQKDDSRIIHFPINPGDGLRYSGWEYPYQGIEPGEYLFSRPSVGKNGRSFKPFYNILLQRFDNFHLLSYGSDPDLTNSEFKSNKLYEELAKLNVRYIILHYDIDPIRGSFGEPKPVADYLQTQENIKKINSFGKLDIYKVDIPSSIRLIYSPQIKLNYTKINPTLYKVAVQNAKQPFDLLFLENFDSQWEAFIDDQRIEEKSKVFSYANKWTINKSGNYIVTIKYKPQDYVDEGMKITRITILTLILISVPYFVWKLRKI